MNKKDLKTGSIVNRDFESVFLGRRAVRSLDPDFKVSREEIEEIINEAMIATPSAVGSFPYLFLVIETDEAKRKLDDIMWPVDKDRVTQCSFAIIPFADRNWIDYFDDLAEVNMESSQQSVKDMYTTLKTIVPQWWEILTAGNGEYLDQSINFQVGLVTQSLMIAARAHGLDTGFMDAWTPNPYLNETFGVDLKRFIPQGVLAFGKNIGHVHEVYHREIKDVAMFI